MNKVPNVYLAAGWFNPEQKKQMEEIYGVLKQLHTEQVITLFAPFYDGIVLEKGMTPEVKRQKMREVWTLDITKVKEADLVVACTQDHDTGTIFECGYASATGSRILCYNSKPELGLNVMLSYEASGFVKTPDDLRLAVHDFVNHFNDEEPGSMGADYWRWNLWDGEPV